MSKLNFKKPSGESRLSEESKNEIAKVDLQRFNFDLPKELAVKLKIRAATQGTTMRNIAVDALSKYLND
jgi:hypothetical protein